MIQTNGYEQKIATIADSRPTDVTKWIIHNTIRGSRGGWGWAGGPDPPREKSQVTIGILRKTGTDHLEKHLDPLSPIASRGRSVQPSVKYVDD